MGPGCVKTHLSRGRSELYSQLPSASSTTSAIGIRNDEIEMEILRASSASEFSHSLGHVWTAPGWQGLSSRFAALVGAAMCPAF
jgi:hypothetical protein